ncbi:MAG: hypothetical protein KatS3mg059_1642 [Thermomicrobiales bacterium]|nr:MAG: hypothetical protein KatS3mg059_1642 [Thermomicrobiales bacterium]
MDAICREVGRDPATLERSAAVMVDFPGAYGRPGQTVPSLTGSPEELAEEFRAYAREGISHLQLYPDPCTVAGIEALAPVLEILDQRLSLPCTVQRESGSAHAKRPPSVTEAAVLPNGGAGCRGARGRAPVSTPLHGAVMVRRHRQVRVPSSSADTSRR